jgi:hypothetical protein
MKKLIFYLSVLVGLSFGLYSCDLNEEEKSSSLQIWLTDAPGDFQEVNVDIKDVQIHYGEGEGEAGWKSINVNAGIYNLIELTNGLETLLGNIEIPPGKISQIRLVLGNRNTIRVNDQLYDLLTPSSEQSGLKIQVHETLTAGITYKVLLDFDAALSVVETGNGGYILKPVIRSMTEAQDGAIKGVVNPAAAHPAIFVVDNVNHADTIASTFSDEAGNFLIRGLSAGNYHVAFVPDTTYQITSRDNVSVTVGEVTDLGTISIEEAE